MKRPPPRRPRRGAPRPARRVRKPTLRAERAKRETHPEACDYPRYANQIDRHATMFATFQKTAKLLGEVEAGLEAFYQIALRHGMLAVPESGANICSEHLAVVHREAESLTALLSTEAKLLIPVIFMLVGDKNMAKVMGVELDADESEETLH